MVAAALLFACLLPPVTPLAQTPPPSAEKVLSGLPELLPGFKLPWQVDPIVRRWKSEAEWKKAHPGLREQVQQLVTGLRRMSDPDWQRMRQETEKQLQAVEAAGMTVAPSALTAADQETADQRALIELFYAMRKSQDRASVLKTLEEKTSHLLDEATAELAKIDRPDLLAKGQEPAGVAKVRVQLQVWSEDYLRQNLAEVDFDEAKLNAFAENTRKNLQAIADALIPLASKQAEDELTKLYSYGQPEKYQQSIEQQIQKLNALAGFTVSVSTSRPALGDAAHAVLIRGREADAGRPIVQGIVQVRRGRAVFQVEFLGANVYAKDTLAKEVESALGRLIERAEKIAGLVSQR